MHDKCQRSVDSFITDVIVKESKKYGIYFLFFVLESLAKYILL